MSPLKLDDVVRPVGIIQSDACSLIDFVVTLPRSSDLLVGLLRGKIARGMEA